MEVLVTYDVSTETAEGRRRLRRVAKVCQAYGQRVQKSVFECIVGEVELEELKYRLQEIIDANQDSLRFYRLREPNTKYTIIYGKKPEFDIRDILIV